ncbi:hypothetical protein AXF42_Ash012712 [Apostasia shenzhenica]|uniref:Uncharacterized protein n=1 Tax=Apostasia shenzhenica TaxID=1088818 RepID=A0A2H9ZTG4_9ASPA|nr:hypothetical protein AXF42_Ash012712 [Apostasia shenzhenica]
MQGCIRNCEAAHRTLWLRTKVRGCVELRGYARNCEAAQNSERGTARLRTKLRSCARNCEAALGTTGCVWNCEAAQNCKTA